MFEKYRSARLTALEMDQEKDAKEFHSKTSLTLAALEKAQVQLVCAQI